MTTRLEKRLEEQRHSHQRRILSAVVLGLLFVSIAGATYLWLGGNFEQTKRAGVVPGHKINILVLGVDERGDDVGRSDTTFVITLDTQTKAVAMLSIPRDTRVKIPGHGWDKINHAYAEGGSKLSKKAVEDLLGIPVDYTVVINFASFNKIIDAVGGVDIDVEKRMYYSDPYDDNGGLLIDLRPGMQHLDGRTAIQYVRYRDEEGDIGRVARQQKFMKAMLQKVASPSIIVRVPGIIKEVSAAVKTDMPVSEMLNLAKILNDASKEGLKTDMVAGKPAYIDDISYWLPDMVALREHVAQIEGIAADAQYVAAAKKLETEYETSVPKEMKVVELPKSLQNKLAANSQPQPPKPAATEKPSVLMPPVPPKAPERLQVEVVNASGVADAGEKIATILRGQGLDVVSVSTAGTPASNSIIVTHTTNSAVVNKVTGLPFKYVLQVTKDDSRADMISVVVGKDYK